MRLKELFKKHIEKRVESSNKILEKNNFQGIILASGSVKQYFLDDLSIPFVPNPYFSHWCPLQTPEHFIIYSPAKKPELLFYQAEDFWHEQDSVDKSFWKDFFSISIYRKKEDALKKISQKSNYACIGPREDFPLGLEKNINPKMLMPYLNWERACKTEYEIECIKEANRRAAKSHQLVFKAFNAGASELDLHHLYLQSSQCLERDLPYPTIIAQDEKSAILHYQNKRLEKDKRVLLIDAGYKFNGYASDITRTYLREDSERSLFASLLESVSLLKEKICKRVQAGVSFLALHKEAHSELAKILLESKILIGCHLEEAMAKGLSATFFPHGLGHMLGLQVHDVGGLQKNAAGDPCEKSLEFPKLRANRPLREGEMITIEPGLYFIPMLLKKAFEEENKRFYNKTLCDELSLFGGMRFEDNLLVRKKEGLNLSRLYLK